MTAARGHADLRDDRPDPARSVAAAVSGADRSDALGCDDATVPARPPSQFRAGPPPALTSKQYAKDLNETEAYGALNSTVRTPEETAIAWFWNANGINQYNQTMQNVISTTAWTSSTPRTWSRWQNSSRPTPDGLLRLQVLLPRLAADHRDPERRQGRQPRHDRRPRLGPLVATPTHPDTRRARMPDERLHRRTCSRPGEQRPDVPCREPPTAARR